jgi:hypothetical protein
VTFLDYVAAYHKHRNAEWLPELLPEITEAFLIRSEDPCREAKKELTALSSTLRTRFRFFELSSVYRLS